MIETGNILAVKNPMWLSDTFVFAYCEELSSYLYVKVNHLDKIEEIGVDIEKRMHGTPIGKMCTKEPTKEQVDAFRCIGAEYWHKIFKDFKRSEIFR